MFPDRRAVKWPEKNRGAAGAKVVLPMAAGLAIMAAGWGFARSFGAPEGAFMVCAFLAAFLPLDLALRRGEAPQAIPARARATGGGARGGGRPMRREGEGLHP